MPSSKLESEMVQRIHHSAVLVNGTKRFGQYDALVETGYKTTTINFNPGKPTISVILSAMERSDRLKETITRILAATRLLDAATRILIMDNSIQDGLEAKMFSWIDCRTSDFLESVVYCHNPRMTQTLGRNIAVKHLTRNSTDIILWDGDIYCENRCLTLLDQAWKENPHLMAIAPALIGYNSGKIDNRISKFSDIATSEKTRSQTHMPGKIGEEIWIRQGNLMRATMMRGAFWVKRKLVDAVAATNPNSDPWITDFISLNNVPFFIAARELGFDFAYLLDPDAIVAQDDRVDAFSVGFSLPMRETQTLMEIVALMVRNQVYTSNGQEANPRFLQFNIGEITRSSSVNKGDARLIQTNLLELAKLISTTNDNQSFMSEYSKFKPTIDKKVLSIIDRVVNRMCSDESLNRIKAMKSIKPSRMMYSVED